MNEPHKTPQAVWLEQLNDLILAYPATSERLFSEGCVLAVYRLLGLVSAYSALSDFSPAGGLFVDRFAVTLEHVSDLGQKIAYAQYNPASPFQYPEPGRSPRIRPQVEQPHTEVDDFDFLFSDAGEP